MMAGGDAEEGFNEEYIAWMQHTAKVVAATLKELEPARITEILAYYEAYIEHPASMHIPLEPGEGELIAHLVGKDRIKHILLMKTEAIIFAPSILAPYACTLDYGTAMYRRYPLRGLWFSVIALNDAYLKSATRSMLRYMLEHELAQGEIYAELAMQQVKTLSLELKGLIHEEARMRAIQWSCISTEEVNQERALILELAARYPLVPVHLASASLFRYLEENWELVKQFGLPSRDEREKELEIPLEKLVEWSDFSISAFKLFLKDLKKELTSTGTEYGIAIV